MRRAVAQAAKPQSHHTAEYQGQAEQQHWQRDRVPVKGSAPDPACLTPISPEPSSDPWTELGSGWRTRPARRGMGWTRPVVVGMGRIVDPVWSWAWTAPWTGRSWAWGLVGAGAATAVPVPNRSVTQYPFRTHPDTDPGIGRVEQDLPMGRRVQELLVELGADITVGAAAGGDDLGQGAAAASRGRGQSCRSGPSGTTSPARRRRT